MTNQPKVILIILDGWGYNPVSEGNAIAQANKPVFDRLWQNYPHTLLTASGEAVGLPWGEIGSSEVGHLTIGSGQVIYQDLPRVTRAIDEGSFFQNSALKDAIDYVVKKRSALHLVGLLSAGGVHSHIYHLESLLKLIKQRHLSQPIYLHLFTDGRDTPPNSSPMYIDKITRFLDSIHLPVKIVSLAGRYYGMDRDNHWDRTLLAYENLVEGKGAAYSSANDLIQHSYSQDITDEFITPAVILQSPPRSLLSHLFNKKPADVNELVGTIKDNDAVIFFNFRPDRMRQLLELFCFPRHDIPSQVIRKNLFIATMTEYNENLPVHVAFPPERIKNTLSKILNEHNLTQLHTAETEKYAHVTYFFDGGNPVPNKGEKWYLVPSPKVPTYDLAPEMSAETVARYVIQANKNEPFDFILINFANADMVGHTGNFDAAIKGVEAIDRALDALLKSFPKSYFLITGDHGNAEAMINPQTGGINTKHSLNPVPFIIAHPSLQISTPQPTALQPSGIIADITPTVLAIFGIEPYPEMTGYNLLESLSPTFRAAQKVTESLAAMPTNTPVQS